jgi:uncharacterized membrane protein
MFESLFKFDRIHFAEGAVGFQSGSPVVFVVLCGSLLAALAMLYWWTGRYASGRDRALSFGLRAIVLLLLFIPLFEPVLIRPDVVPDENFVAVLVDASESMNIPDGQAGMTRRDEVNQLLFGEGGAIAPALDEVFKVRYYTFGEQARRVDSVTTVLADGRGTDISAALDRVLSDFRGLPLAGVVLLTDGGDNSDAVALNKAEALRERDVPLHVIGLGQESADSERELLEARVSRGVEETTGAEIDVKVRSGRTEAEPVAISLYRDDELVHTDRRVLKGGGRVDQFTLFYEPENTEAHEYTLRLADAADEFNTENNALNVLIDPRRDTLRVLYIEGRPRRDFKFTRRALVDDPAVQFTSILRTGTGTFYRQGVRSADELAGGFPNSDDELFDFHAVLFGDAEAAQFSLDQLAMLERFVRLRGGGFAMLGGQTTFAEGAYWNSPIADLLPVTLDPSRRTVIPRPFGDEQDPPDEKGYQFVPTAAGLESPILRLAGEPSANQARWGDMPGLTSINYLGATKPGAAVLAEKPDDEFGAREPVLIVQRYGKGRSAALATASTWRWQMLLDAEDQRHERFWRQFVRWLAASAPGQVDLMLDDDRVAPGDDVPLTVDVYNAQYQPLSNATVQGTVTDPLGNEETIAFRPDLGEAGSYTATLLPAEEGVYSLDIAAESEGVSIGQQSRSLLVRSTRQEYYDAVLQRPFLEQLAETAGGFYYAPDAADALAANLQGRRSSTSIFTVDYLWDMPFLFGLIVALLSIEWVWRRRRGLP